MKSEILLPLVKKEIAELKSRLRELKDIEIDLEKNAGQDSHSKKRGPRQGTITKLAVGQIQAVLAEATNDLSPAQIFGECQKRGYNLTAQMIRQILSRNREYFESPKHGRWRSKTVDEGKKVARLF